MLIRPTQIPASGGATSQALNSAVTSLFGNQADLLNRAQTLTDALIAFEQRTLLQLMGMTARLSTLAIPAAVETDVLYLDAHDLRGAVVSGQDIQHLALYGMIAPLVTPSSGSYANQFTLTDARGQTFIPRETLIQTTPAPGWAPWTPLTADAAYRSKMLKAFDGQPATAFSETLTGENIYLRATLPLDSLLDPVTNAIAIHPEPSFAAKLLEAAYTTGGGEGNMIADAVGWPDVTPAGGFDALPTLFIIPPVQTSRISFVYSLMDTAPLPAIFSISHLGAYHLQWASSGTASIDVATLLPTDAVLTAGIANVGDDDEFELNVNGTVATATLITDAATQVPKVIRTLKLSYA